ncbi:MAG: 5-bromo-4-chloroindolyl phosphate hydrolysis family protein [Lachnospiraceae bacterium]|nr:5-bromo-4-chloroindolyl phosphate hydrolysis family protein [Lachnospiraceae bacterium]
MADNQLFNEIGREIKDGLAESLSKGDFSRLNEAISNSVNMAIDEATEQLERSTGIKNGNPVNVSSHRYSSYSPGSATRERQKQLERERQERQARRDAQLRERQERSRQRRANATKAQKEQLQARRQQIELQKKMRSPNAIVESGKLLPTKFNAIGDTGSLLGIAFGITGAIVCGLVSLVFFLAKEVPSDTIVSLVSFALTVISAGFIVWGIEHRKFLNRAKRYARICGEKMYAKISQIAAASGITERELKKDIRKMLKSGVYPEGYMDEGETTLMLSTDVYRDYEQMLGRMRTEEAAKEAELTGEEQSELDVMVKEGMDAVKKLHALNDDIPGEVISKKLDCLEGLLKQMFDRVKEHPEQMDRMHKLMDYYLPTMLKLVEAYAEYDKVSAPGKEIIQAKAEIENTLDTINEAFVQLLNNLFQDSVWDVTSDAQVLTTMLTQEGLAQESALKTQ